MPELLRPLFWSYRFDELRLPDDQDLVVMHVLSYGGPAHLRWLRRRFGDGAIRSWIIKRRGKGLTPAQMTRWVSEATARKWQAENPGAQIWENR